MKVVLVSKEGKKRSAEIARSALKKGEVVVCPTDTVYGLLADATNKKAVLKVFLIKGRKQEKPLPIFVKDIAMAKSLAKVSRKQEELLESSWPGKVTLVLKSKGKLQKETGTTKTIGLRIPKHQLVQAILQETNVPLTGTSANLAGRPSLGEGKKVELEFQKRTHQPDLLLDAGKLAESGSSRVVDITTSKPKVLRK
jgi:L-threonylcarbamoyladenylate synthase